MSMYRIGVEIAMHGNASSFLGLIVKDLIGMNGQIGKAVAGLGRVKLALAGVGTIMAGGAILGGLSHIEKAGEVLVNAKTQLSASLPIASRLQDMALATSAAWAETGRNQQTTVAENIDALKHLQNITQNMHHSVEMLPIMNDLKTTIVNASGKDGKPMSHDAGEVSAMNFTRAIEQVKGNNMADISRVIPELKQTIIGLGGRVNGSQYLSQVQAAGAAGIVWNDTMLTKTLPALMLVTKQAGVLLQAANSNMVQGVASNSSVTANNRVKWGFQKQEDLIDPKKPNLGFKFGSGFEAGKMMEDVGAWGKDVREMLKARGVDVNNNKEMMQVIGEVARGNRSFQKFLDEVLLPKQSAALANETSKVANTSPDADKDLKNSPAAQRDAMHAQMESAMQGLGEQLVPQVLPAIKAITSILTEVNKWEAANPEKLRMIGAALTGLGAGLVAIGAVLLTSALVAAIGVGGWLVVGLAALGGVLAALGVNFDSIKTAWTSLMASLPTASEIVKAMTDIGHNLSAAIASIPGYCMDAIKGMASSIGNAISNALPSASSILHKFGIGHGDAASNSSPAPGKQSYNGPTMSGTQKQAINARVILSGRDVGRIALNDVARSEARAGSISGYDTSLHPDYASV